MINQQLEEKIKISKAKLEESHAVAIKLFAKDGIPGALKNEFNIKTDQYDSMFNSIEDMKSLSTKDEMIDNLLQQQMEGLRVRIEWERDIIKRALNYV
ncbi:MAG: hypothetical protein K5773_05655 [Pseudobutyrivibrio sp.]|nr:hypothetical protein [Pseudobutyrivibrio sp.]